MSDQQQREAKTAKSQEVASAPDRQQLHFHCAKETLLTYKYQQWLLNQVTLAKQHAPLSYKYALTCLIMSLDEKARAALNKLEQHLVYLNTDWDQVATDIVSLSADQIRPLKVQFDRADTPI